MGCKAFYRHAEIRRRAAGVDIAVVQILAGAKTAAGAGDQQAAHAIIALGLLQTFRQLVMHQIVKTVEAVRAIEGNGHDALFHCAENESFHD